MAYQLREYQKEAVDRTLEYFRKTRDPAVIVLPTGAGKSLVIAELARLAQGRVLVLAHVKELVEQNHAKFLTYDQNAGIYSAGLDKKDTSEKVIFGSIQSVANADSSFFEDYSLLVIDECHRVSLEPDSQYAKVIKKLRSENANICILGLTATPYRLGFGWIYNYSHKGVMQTTQARFFKHCVYELGLDHMIKNKYLTPPVTVDIPVTCYDFSELSEKKMYTTKEVEDLLKKQKRLTPLIVKNVVDIVTKYKREGVMIFAATVKHAKEIMESLPPTQAKMILGDTDSSDRDKIIQEFKDKKIKYLVNVSVLTTGFDAPHVDVIAILRPTESVSLYQQIVGRGLRLAPDKKDCFVLDYTGVSHDIYSPTINDKKSVKDSVAVVVTCPQCGFENDFWGRINMDGEMIEHYGRKCRGGEYDIDTYEFKPCGYLFRFKICHNCGEKNEVGSRECFQCKIELIDADAALKQARLSKNAHILKADSMELNKKSDKRGNEYLQIKYYDWDGKHLSEIHYLDSESSIKKFNINFLRSHMRRPELEFEAASVDQVIKYQALLRAPFYVIARKQEKYWRITEKIFAEDF